ncbi:TfoX [Clostridium carboxidivorans P7]|nr:TfoX [Clostridium carboxidivorans P7]
MLEAIEELPYDGAKPMLLVENVDNKELLYQLITEMYEELPMPKAKKKK